MEVNNERCESAGLDPKRIRSIARRLSRAAMQAQALGLIVFGGAGSGDLRLPGGSQGILASLDGSFDGGDGGDEY